MCGPGLLYSDALVGLLGSDINPTCTLKPDAEKQESNEGFAPALEWLCRACGD